MAKPKFIYTPEDINQRFDEIWKSLRRNRSADVSSVDLGADLAPDTVRKNTIQFNEFGDVWYIDRAGNSVEISGGASTSGIDDVLAEGQSLTAVRTIDLDGNGFNIQHNLQNFLSISPTLNAEGVNLLALNGTVSDTGSQLELSASEENARFKVEAQYNNGQILSIDGNTVDLTILYTALTHTFQLPSTSSGLFRVFQTAEDLLSIDNLGFRAYMQAYDGTARTQLTLDADLGDDGAKFGIDTTDGSNVVSIIGNAVTSTITHTADTHTFNGKDIFGTASESGVESSTISFQSTQSTGDGNSSALSMTANPSLGEYSLSTFFNDGDTRVSIDADADVNLANLSYLARYGSSESKIELSATAAGTTITHTAGIHTFNGRVLETQGAGVTIDNVDSSLTLGMDGNTFEVLVDTNDELEGIVNTDWPLGSKVLLLFGATPVTVVHNQSDTGAKKGIILALGSNLTTASGDTLYLCYCSIGGVEKWREIYQSTG